MLIEKRRKKTAPTKVQLQLMIYLCFCWSFELSEYDYFNIYKCSPRTLFRYIKELNESQSEYHFHHVKKAKLFYAEKLQSATKEISNQTRLARLLKIINHYTKNSFYIEDRKPTAQKVQSEILPDVNIRTLQRDLKDINKAMDMLYEYAYENDLI